MRWGWGWACGGWASPPSPPQSSLQQVGAPRTQIRPGGMESVLGAGSAFE